MKVICACWQNGLVWMKSTMGLGFTVTTLVIDLMHPLEFTIVRVTLCNPAVANRCWGFCRGEVPPSPKSQAQERMPEALGTEASVNSVLLPRQGVLNVKSGAGSALTMIVLVIVSLQLLVFLTISVTVLGPEVP